MDPKEKSVLSEDGRRLTIGEEEITGNESSGEGLGYQIDNPDDNEADDKRYNETHNKEQS